MDQHYANRRCFPNRGKSKEWFEAGVTCVGMGSKLFPAEVLANKNYSYISQKCRKHWQLSINIKENKFIS
jgi:2-keto-3-deoxy-6-phosphogluconate aldolase